MNRQASAMERLWRAERGAALVTVLLFMVLILILITSMLTVAGNEAVISGLQRDGVRALELAQGGVQEAIRRMEEGRPFSQGFTSSISPNVNVAVVRRVVGTNSTYEEIQATATAGRATRRLSFLVLRRMLMFPPNILYGDFFQITTGGTEITSGDVYGTTFVAFKAPTDITSTNTYVYSGWRTSWKPSPTPADLCYAHDECIAKGGNILPFTGFYPGSRRGEMETGVLGSDIKAQTLKCPAGGGGTLPTDTVSGVLSTDMRSNDPAWAPETTVTGIPAFGFDTDDPDGAGPLPPQAVTAKLPCGLPYKIVSQSFVDENGVSQTRLFKSIVFEQWFDNYWQFNEAELNYQKKSNFTTYPQFGAVPPFPDFQVTEGNYDRKVTGGGAVTSGDFGCKMPEMALNVNCTPPVTRPILVWFDGGNFTLDGPVQGHGTLVVDGNLTINSGVEWWGTIIVNGDLILSAGSLMIHGGLVARTQVWPSGSGVLEAGGTVTMVPVGRSIVLGKAWWER